MYSLFNILVIFELLWDFSDCLSFSPSLFVSLVVSMAPKCKSALSQCPLCSGASSSLDPIPSHIRFHDEDARGVHSKRRVILADFADTDLPTVIHNWG